MSTADKYLDAMKVALNLPSDNQLAIFFGTTRHKICSYRRGDITMSDERCIHIAQVLGIDPATVILEVQAERARKSERYSVAEVLENLLRKLNNAPALLSATIISFVLLGASDPAQANISTSHDYSNCHDGNDAIICVMSTLKRRCIIALQRVKQAFEDYVNCPFVYYTL